MFVLTPLLQRFASNDPGTVDLHGTTVNEAIVLIKEVLEAEGSSQSMSLIPSECEWTKCQPNFICYYQVNLSRLSRAREHIRSIK